MISHWWNEPQVDKHGDIGYMDLGLGPNSAPNKKKLGSLG